MNKDGRLTSKTAETITLEYSKGYDVYFDHGEPGPFMGTIVSSIDAVPRMGEELSQLDIAVIEKSSRRAVALIEIEETTDTPKTFLGDIFGILMGNSVSFKGNTGDWKIGSWTTLIVLGCGENHGPRNERLRELALRAKSALGTGNSHIGDIRIASFSEELSLKDAVMKEIELARQKAGPMP